MTEVPSGHQGGGGGGNKELHSLFVTGKTSGNEKELGGGVGSVRCVKGENTARIAVIEKPRGFKGIKSGPVPEPTEKSGGVQPVLSAGWKRKERETPPPQYSENGTKFVKASLEGKQIEVGGQNR